MACQHGGCRCDQTFVQRDGKGYCSERCAQEATGHAEHCGCGHAECHAARQR